MASDSKTASHQHCDSDSSRDLTAVPGNRYSVACIHVAVATTPLVPKIRVRQRRPECVAAEEATHRNTVFFVVHEQLGAS